MKLSTLTKIVQTVDMDGLEYSSEEYAARIIEELDRLPERITFIAEPITTISDSGISEMLEINDDNALDEEVGPFIRIVSWDPDKRHIAIKPFKGAVCRVTLELE